MYLFTGVCMLLFLYLFISIFSSGMAENEANDAKNEVCDPDSHSEINRYSNFIMTVFFLARRLAHFYHQPEYRQI